MDYVELEKLVHKLQTNEEKIIELVNKYPNDMQLGEQIRKFIRGQNNG
tara:strand:+ start:415 stop:558 length:144 start_codon:yes stop_codon:yes gene_type:complete